jgi:type VI secretion system secreted protein VgrG
MSKNIASAAASLFLETEHEVAELTIDGRPFRVTRLEGSEGTSRLFRFDITCRREDHDSLSDDLLTKTAHLVLRDGRGAQRVITGVVAESSTEFSDEGGSNVRVVLRPFHVSLTLGRESRPYHDLDVVGIARDVFGRAGVPVRYETTGSYAKRPYTVQYREDDHTFLSRLFEEEGLYYWFDEGTLVLADDSRASPPLEGNPVLEFRVQRGMHSEGEVVSELADEARTVPGAFVVSSFDPDRPALGVGGKTGKGRLEVYSARGGGVVDPAEAEKRAKVRAERATSGSQGVAGETNSVRFVAGRSFTVVGHPLSRFDKSFLLTEVSTRVTQRQENGTQGGKSQYECLFRGLDRDVSYRPPRTAPPAKQAGLQTGTVVGPAGSEIFPDARGRVRVQANWDRVGGRDDKAGHWLRVAQRGTGSSMLLPRVGWTVLTFNEEGSVDTPSVLSRIFDGEHLPPYGLPANKTRLVLKTATSPGGGSFNEIRFEDRQGSEEMFINASRDMNMLTLRARREHVKHDQKRVIGNDQTLNVLQSFAQRIGKNQTVEIGANETQTVDGGKNKTVLTNETLVVGGKRSITTGSDHTTEAKNNRSLKVGAALIDVSLNTITADASKLHSVLVGGAMIKITKETINEDVGKATIATVGGIKLEVAKEKRTLDVRKVLFETVGGAMLFEAEKRYLDVADKSNEWVSGDVLEAKAPVVFIEAIDKIELVVGGGKIVILPEKVEITAPSFDLSKAKIVRYTTAEVTHN